MADAANTEEIEQRIFVIGRAEKAPWSVDVRIRLHHELISKVMLLICDGSINYYQAVLMISWTIMREVVIGRPSVKKTKYTRTMIVGGMAAKLENTQYLGLRTAEVDIVWPSRELK